MDEMFKWWNEMLSCDGVAYRIKNDTVYVSAQIYLILFTWLLPSTRLETVYKKKVWFGMFLKKCYLKTTKTNKLTFWKENIVYKKKKL